MKSSIVVSTLKFSTNNVIKLFFFFLNKKWSHIWENNNFLYILNQKNAPKLNFDLMIWLVVLHNAFHLKSGTSTLTTPPSFHTASQSSDY